VEALKEYILTSGRGAEDTFSDLRTTAPEFDSLLPPMGEYEREILSVHEASLRNDRIRIFEAINEVLVRISKEKPLVLFIDDLHWGDMGSIHLLHYIARNIKGLPILLLGAARSEELAGIFRKSEYLSETLDRLRKEGLVDEIPLERLTKSDTKQIVKSSFNTEVPDDISELIHGKTCYPDEDTKNSKRHSP
jgi:predicted ATPase